VLLGGCFVERPGDWTKSDVHSASLRFVGPLPIWTVSFGGVGMAGTARLTAFHSARQDRSRTETFQVLQLLP